MRRALVFICAAATLGTGGCVNDRDPACAAAEACDRALAEPFGDFDADDPAFGDGGTCWQSADTARPCTQTCEQFRADQRQSALEQAEAALGTNKEVPLAIFVACGGDLESQAAGDASQ
jgi:hypothetical protein